jgi:hypothetical protein
LVFITMLTNMPFNSPVSFLTAANPSSGQNPDSPSSSTQLLPTPASPVPCSWLVIVDGKRRVRDRGNYRVRDARNVEMSPDLLVERLRDWLKRHCRDGQGSLWLFVALEDTVI